MPTQESLDKLARAEEQMRAAQEAHLAFIERPDRDFSNEGRLQNRQLLDRLQQSMAQYWEAFEEAKRS